MHHRALLFMWILGVGEVKGGGLNSGPLACITSTLSTEISAKPKSFLFHDGWDDGDGKNDGDDVYTSVGIWETDF